MDCRRTRFNPARGPGLEFTRSRRTAWFATATLVMTASVVIGATPPAAAQSQGPNNPSRVVNDASVGTQPWMDPQNAAISDDMYAFFNIVVHEFVADSQYLKATGFGFAIPNGMVIQGIEMRLERFGISAFDQNVRSSRVEQSGQQTRPSRPFQPTNGRQAM
jgi:hypothetical protein